MNDLRFAFRQLRKTPGFTLVALFTLAIGIGANTAIFSVFNAMLLSPLPFRSAQRIMVVNEAFKGNANGSSGGSFLDWYQNNQYFDKLAALHPINKIVTGLGDPLQAGVGEVSDEFLQVFGLTPAQGRDFVPADDAPGGNPHVAIVTHEFWQAHLQGRKTAVGESLRLDGTSYLIIGILPPAALLDPTINLLAPSAIRSAAYKQDRNYSYVTTVFGLLKSGVSPQQAEAQLSAVKQRLNSEYPAYKAEWTVSVQGLQENMFGSSRPYILMILGAAGLVLLIACANIANLLLARTTARQAEIALRLALGATRWRIIRQLLTESLLLSLLGGVAGVWIGAFAIDPLARLSGLNAIQGFTIGLDFSVLNFALGISLLTGLIFGCIPALQAARTDVNSHLKEGTRGATAGRRARVQALLIVSETALTVVLLVTAGVLLRSFMNVARADPGFFRDGVLTFEVSQSGATATTVEKRIQFSDAILRELRQIPGVAGVGMASTLPMNNRSYLGDQIRRADRPETDTQFNCGFDAVSPDFFEAMGIPLLRGRTLTAADNRADAPKVLVVNSALVDRLYSKDEDALGGRLFFKGESWEIVGITGNVRRFALEAAATPQVYQAQYYFPWSTQYVVRTSLPPLSLVAQVRQAVRRVDPDQPIANVSTMEAAAKSTLQGRTTMLTLLGLFAGIALLLACIGIYGVMSYSIGQRTREIGIRMALGASAQRVAKLVLRHGLALVLAGLVIGAVGAGFANQILGSQLYDVGRLDPFVFIGVAALLLLVGGIASWLPARRATRLDPTVALRAD